MMYDNDTILDCVASSGPEAKPAFYMPELSWWVRVNPVVANMMKASQRLQLEEAERRVEESQARQRVFSSLPEPAVTQAPLELEPIKARLAFRGEELASYLLDRGLEDIEALVAEVERLREEARR